jgi:hypothetical protein
MLEQEIAKLSENIRHLSKLLETIADASKLAQSQTQEVEPPKVEKVKAKPQEEQSETPQEETAKGFTHNDGKSLAMNISRKDRTKRDDIKAKLAEYDAVVMTDLNGDDLQAVCEWLTALKDEVGA